MIRSVLFSAGVAAALCAGSGQAHADLTLGPPKDIGPNTPVTVMVGNFNNIPTISWVRDSDGFCLFQTIGTINGLFDNITVQGGNLGDSMRVISASQATCMGHIFTPLTYGARFLDLHGLSGNDQLISFTAGDTDIQGGFGNDVVVSFNPGGRINGNDGDDLVQNLSSGSANTLLGGPGNDCLHDVNGAALFFRCESGSSDRQMRPVPAGSLGCERTVPSC